MKILITSATVEGRSTLAALVSRRLTDFGIPHELVDHPSENGDAHQLLTDHERFDRNVMSIANRDSIMQRKLVIETKLVSREPLVNIEGDFDGHIELCTAAVRFGTYAEAVRNMREAFAKYGGPVRGVVWNTLQMGHLNLPERTALAAVYELTRLALNNPDYEALPEG